jgi:L-ribulose-5-phosphate 3-epimerase
MNTDPALNTDPAPGAPYTRRNFVRLMTAAGATLPLTAAVAQAQSASDKKKKKGTAAVPAAAGGGALAPAVIHVFSKPLQWMSFDETAALAAETGCGGIDYTVRPGGHVLPEKVQEDLPRAIDAARKKGLKVDMITTGITSARDRHTEPLLRTAAKHGVKVYRFGNFQYDANLGVWESLQKLKPVMKELADLNQSLGVHGAVQNHAGARVGGPIWDLYELLRDLNPRWIGVQYDIRHATVEGAQSWPLALRLLAPWIKNTDIKDFRWNQSPGRATVENVPLGEGIVNFEQYFKLVSELKISGPISLHLEYPPFERVQISEAEKRAKFPALMRKDLTALKSWLAKHNIA